tara:strand:+ start:8405 stop:9175 length:771 start_codon:yes stop_codon:yes gene_type:complete
MKKLKSQRLNKCKSVDREMEKFKKNIQLTPVERIKNLKFPNEIDSDLAYFCGVLAGDGHIGYRENKKEYLIKCVGNPKDEKEFYNILMKKLIKKLFNLDIRLRYHDKKTTYGFSLYSKNVLKYLTEFIGLPLGKKYDKLKIPEIFLKDKELVRNFISGVSDTDFHLAIRRRNYPVIKGTSKSRLFIEEIKNFLESGGFKVCIYERRDFDRRINKIVITHRIELSGFNQLRKWLEEIKFRHPKIIKKINFLKENSKL